MSRSKAKPASLCGTSCEFSGPYNGASVAENVKSYAKIPGPFCLPIVGNLLSFASFTPTAHLTWSSWAKAFGKIYK